MEITFEDALDFARQVKRKFSAETDTFKEFVSLMKQFRKKRIDRKILLSKLRILFRGHTDLIKGLYKFIPENHDCTLSPKPQLPDGVKAPGGNLPSEPGSSKDSSRVLPRNRKVCECINFFNTVRKRLENDEKYREFLEALCKYQVHKDIDHLDKDAFNIFRQKPELYVEFSRILVDIIEGKDLVWKGKRNLCQVPKKNPYEERLFECENQMFNAGLTFHHLESTREAAIRCLENQDEVESKKFGAEKFYKPSNLRVIKNMFSSCEEEEYAELVMEQLLHNQPIRASQLILKHLDEKIEEIKQQLEEARESWAATLKINDEKARNYQYVGKKQGTPSESKFSQGSDRTCSQNH